MQKWVTVLSFTFGSDKLFTLNYHVFPVFLAAKMRAFIVIILAGIVQSIIASFDSTAVQNNGLKRTPLTMRERFAKMCKSYDRESKDGQYAVAWIGDEDYSPSEPVTLKDAQIEKGDGDKYYVVAAPGLYKEKDGSKKPGKHSEQIIFDEIEEQVKRYREKNAGKTPEVYLFTKKSPCCYNQDEIDEDCTTGCSGRIRKWSLEQRIKVTVAWDVKYGTSEKAQLYSINNILKSPYAHINWEIENGIIQQYCAKHNPIWFQKKMFDCLVQKEKAAAALCSNDEKLFKGDMAKFVNRMIWECGTAQKVAEPEEAKAEKAKPKNKDTQSATDVRCWKEKSKRYAKFGERTYGNCIQQSINGGKSGFQFGPPLDPDNPDVYNKALRDFNEKTEKFCFTP